MTSLADLPSAEADQTATSQTLSVTGRRWQYRDVDQRQQLALSQALGISDIVAHTLAAKGLSVEEADAFLTPTLKTLLPDPSRFKDMDIAAERLADAVQNGERICLFADYDVDGATSSAILARFLRHAGVEPAVYIPDRIEEGYGPSVPAMRQIAEAGTQILVVLDCGTTAYAPMAEATKLGMQTIVVDHHEPEATPLDVYALVNPNRLDEDRTYGHLCTAGLAFVVAVAVNRALRARGHWTAARPEPVLTRWLDLVALGTVCDVVRLTDINRAFVAQGLKVMGQRANPGLRALADVARLNIAPTGHELGFVLGPRINAGGRIGKAGLGATLLRTDDPGEAAAIAAHLDILNAERRDIEAAVLEDAIYRVEKMGDPGAVVVCAGENWHPGVVGIVASRLVERFNRPACVISMDGAQGTGSGRSVNGVDLGAAIIAARQKGFLIKGGGHSMAAGFTVAADAVDAFKEFINERILAQGGVPAAPDLILDGLISPGGATLELAEEIAKLSPFGPGNAEPRLAIDGVRIAFADVVGTDHVKIQAMAAVGGGRVEGIAFRAVGSPLGETLLKGRDKTMRLAGRLKTNTWQGRTKVSFHIEDAMSG